MSNNLGELLPEMFSRSKLMYLDFTEIPRETPPDENIANYFAECEANGINPRLPEYRQAFNDRLLEKTGARYLVSRYGEDRRAMLAGSKIAQEDRTLHMGIDIFSKDLEPIWSPCPGAIVRTGREPGDHSYGNYMIFQPDGADFYLFFGHLGPTMPHTGQVEASTHIAHVGDYKNGENGGWSRHLHLQILTNLPPEGVTPPGYSTKSTFAATSQSFPNPFDYFPDWTLVRAGGSIV